MFRELIIGLAIVFMAGSVIIGNIFRSTKSDKPQLPAKNVTGSNVCLTDERDISAPEHES